MPLEVKQKSKRKIKMANKGVRLHTLQWMDKSLVGILDQSAVTSI